MSSALQYKVKTEQLKSLLSHSVERVNQRVRFS